MNILLIQLKRIGDLILTTPAIAALRENFPQAHLSLVVSPAVKELLPAISGVDRILVVGGKADDLFDWLVLARGRFDYCFDFTRNDRSSFLTLLSHAKKRIASNHPQLRAKIRARCYTDFVEAPVGLLHTIDYHLALLKPAGIRDPSPAIRLDLPQTAVEKATHLLEKTQAGDEFIVVHPGSARSEKFWEADRWVEVINHVARDHQIRCVVTGGPSQMEQDHIRTIKSAHPRGLIDLSGRTDVLTLAALVRKARLLVTIDSAPMHFAAAWATPQVALFGPTNPFHWHPRSESATILIGDSKKPLSKFGPEQPPAAMNQISTGSVIDAMESLLSTPAAPTLYE